MRYKLFVYKVLNSKNFLILRYSTLKIARNC